MKVLLIQTTPKTAIVACPAEENKLAFVTFAAVVLANKIINPAAANMIIIIIDGICTIPALFTAKPGVNPSLAENCGNRFGKEPNKTTLAIATAKITTDLMAPGASVVVTSSFEPSRFFTKAGSFILS